MPVIDKPVLTFPEAVSDWVREHYAAATVILEYGTGGSTVMASEMPGKTIFSVESDKKWCANIQTYLDAAQPASAVTLHHVNVGETKKWGAPVTDKAWRQFHRYPLSVWDLPEFVAPDLVLIDGRFRAACLLAVLLRTEKPVTVLFDDYKDRVQYEKIERWVQPSEIRGRMAKFDFGPFEFPRKDMTDIFRIFTKPF
jgi:hypothetical protein